MGLACLVSGFAVVSCNSLHAPFISLPPEEYRQPSNARIWFLPSSDLNQKCNAVVGREDSMEWLACSEIGGPVYMPNPCEFNSYYAKVLCHELAHAQGMPAEE